MLKVEKTWSKENEYPKLSACGAWLEWIADQDLREAMLAANVNILRRTAPYAYFFSGGFTPGIWSADFQDDARKYLATFERMELQRGVWFAYPDCNDPIITTAISVGIGDILPIVYYLNQDRFSLLCLPEPTTLAAVDQMIVQSGDNLEALQTLLSKGGFLVSIIDYQDFTVQTYDNQYASYFPPKS